MKWLAAVAAVAALALLAAALLHLFPGDTEAQTLVPPPDYTDGLYTQVSAGNGITCGVTYLGNIRCWGRNEAGPLYVPSTLTQTEEPRYAWTDVAVTSGYACGLRSDGVMECWGSQESYFPQIPVNDDGKPVTFHSISGALTGFTATSGVLSSPGYLCGLQHTRNGQTPNLVRCMDANSSSAIPFPEGKAYLSKAQFSQVSAGQAGACGRLFRDAGPTEQPDKREAQSVVCWGGDPTDAIPSGLNFFIEVTDPMPEAVENIPVRDISVGGDHDHHHYFACTIPDSGDQAGQAICWGETNNNRLNNIKAANGFTVTNGPPAQRNVNFASVSAGWAHACGLKTNGKLVCWGGDGVYDYGQADVPDSLAGATFSQVSAGYFHTCAIMDGQNGQTAGTLTCWGVEGVGDDGKKLSDFPWIHNIGEAEPPGRTSSGETEPAIPTLPALETEAPLIGAGDWQTCALTADSRLACIGDYEASLDDEEYKVKGFAVSRSNTCVIKKDEGGTEDGKADCWGYSLDSSPLRSEYTTPNNTFSQITYGYQYVCGILDGQNSQTAGTAKCWGLDWYGRDTPPSSVTFSSMAAGFYHACGIQKAENQTAGPLNCWGSTSVVKTQDNPPQDFWGTQHIAKVSIGYIVTCVIFGSSSLIKCSDYAPALLPEEGEEHNVPNNLQYTKFKDVSVSDLYLSSTNTVFFHACGITEQKGWVRCWGNVTGTDYDFGQADVPLKYKYAEFVAVTTGRYHTCAISAGGKMACWGRAAIPDDSLQERDVQLFRPLASQQYNHQIFNVGQAHPNPAAAGAYGGPPSDLNLAASGLLTWQKAKIPLSPLEYGTENQYEVRWFPGSEVTEGAWKKAGSLISENTCDAGGVCRYRIPSFNSHSDHVAQVRTYHGFDRGWRDAEYEGRAVPVVRTPLPSPRPTPGSTPVSTPVSTPDPTPGPTPNSTPASTVIPPPPIVSTPVATPYPTPQATPVRPIVRPPPIVATPRPTLVPMFVLVATPTPTSRPAQGASAATPTPAPFPTPTLTPTPTRTPTPTPTPTRTPTPTATPIPTATASPTPEPTATATPARVRYPRVVLAATAAPTPAATPQPTATVTANAVPTATPAPPPLPEPPPATGGFTEAVPWWLLLILLLLLVIAGYLYYRYRQRRR